MKLGQLKAAIRAHKGPVKLAMSLLNGLPRVEIEAGKGSLLAALDASFAGGRSAETNLWLRADGHLAHESRRGVSDAA